MHRTSIRVSASLDSLVLGEGQILSQLKGAYIAAYSAGFTGTVFNILFQRAIGVGKKGSDQIQALRIHLCLLVTRRLTWRKIA